MYVLNNIECSIAKWQKQMATQLRFGFHSGVHEMSPVPAGQCVKHDSSISTSLTMLYVCIYVCVCVCACALDDFGQVGSVLMIYNIYIHIFCFGKRHQAPTH